MVDVDTLSAGIPVGERAMNMSPGGPMSTSTGSDCAAGPTVASDNINKYLSDWRHVKPILTGHDLKELGIPPGPRMKEILGRLRNTRLDGVITTRGDEVALVRKWLE